MDTCTVEDCDRIVFVRGRGLCQLHYARWRRHGDVSVVKRQHGRSRCRIDRCERYVAAQGLCSTHLKRLQRWGTTDDPPPRPTICAVPECGLLIAAQGLCERHYRRARRGGQPEGYRFCRQCQQPLDLDSKGRSVFCSETCRAAWDYWGRRTGSERDRTLQKKYGISLDAVKSLHERQGGACAICATTTPAGRGNRLHVDHCHTTGAVRGLLCTNCNKALGLFKDDAARLRQAADYVERCRSEV